MFWSELLGLFGESFSYITDYGVFWLPLVLGFTTWRLYLYYINTRWIKELKWILLEVKLPRDIFKSPKAMEIALEAFHHPVEGSKIDQYIKGRVRHWFSLELVSLGGKIHFYIRTPDSFKDLIESRLYSQYPGIEIYEVNDYVHRLPYKAPGSDWDFFGVEFEFTKPDPYPIKTYVDYGLDKEQLKEETKVDPITPILELLGSIEAGEEIWFQVLVMATKDRFKKPGSWFSKQDWKKEAEKEIDTLLKRNPETKGPGQLSPTGFPILPSITEGEKDVAAAIERSIAKFGFDTGIRVLYWGKGDKFDKRTTVPVVMNSVKQFSTSNLNGFKPGVKTDFNYPWQNPFGLRLARLKRKLFMAYRRRAYFYPPYVGKPMVLSSEELATIYHFPGQVAVTPSFSRIESKRSEPPSNLPL